MIRVTLLIGVLTQGKELEWGQGGDGRTEGDDEAFAGQVSVTMKTITSVMIVLTSFSDQGCLC